MTIIRKLIETDKKLQIQNLLLFLFLLPRSVNILFSSFFSFASFTNEFDGRERILMNAMAYSVMQFLNQSSFGKARLAQS